MEYVKVDLIIRAGVLDLGRFLTGALVITGLALPIALTHSHVITTAACALSISGGVLIYGSIVSLYLFDTANSRWHIQGSSRLKATNFENNGRAYSNCIVI